LGEKEVNLIGLEITATYEQDPDDLSDKEQFLTVTVKNSGAGPYLVLNTDEWAIDSPDDLKPLLDLIKIHEELCG